MQPVRKIAETPNLLPNGRFNDQTAGSGNTIKYRSLMTLTMPMMMANGRLRAHSSDASAERYEYWDWPSLGPHMTMKVIIVAK